MLVIPLILAAGSLPTFVFGAPVPLTASSRSALTDASTRSLVERAGDAYRTYGGFGTVANGWPDYNAWVSNFDEMFNNNRGVMRGSCSQFGVPNNSEAETNDIYAAIKQVAGETGLDARFILATMMQESNGCVRAPTTNWGVRNPGLMQDHNGAATCNENGVQNPCPRNTIIQMIRDGAAGTPYGDGLKQLVAKTGASDVSKYYKAARMYNSGSIAAGGNLGQGGATHCYASDIANRLTGWVTVPRTCNEATIGGMTGTGSAGNGNTGNTGGGATSPTGPRAPGASGACTQWYTVQSGDQCGIIQQRFGISMQQLMAWNTGLSGDCSNLWLGYSYCVRA
ncbi:hypothetical protein W97_06890 [Coniosporium apollinis CBS 100218]|uniref:LysM domain-containing protein n=1 Tax=Coniosporium apollinis (strain CBS 100218) TaxID=1168221 RepID=R7Z047_CONA1|nr:uncharacterized protein W97_06890 [Coniosporium apollinis CBS 100218]EON67522.1 hypothetical protein W97_06890 [Coniosporium apollinis CBS 100218]